MSIRLVSRAAAIVALTFAASSGHALLVSIDFNGNLPPVVSPTQTGAGLFGAAGDTWNGLGPAAAQSVPVSLLASDGTGSGVSVSYAATGTFSASCPGGSSYCGTPFESLLRDYLYTDQGVVGTVTLSGLAANASYDLVLYSAPNIRRARQTSFTANGITEVSAFDGAATTLVNGVSYVDMTVAANAAGVIAITFRDAGLTPGGGFAFAEGNLNGLQLRTAAPTTGVPEPGSLALAAAGLLLAAGARRRSRR